MFLYFLHGLVTSFITIIVFFGASRNYGSLSVVQMGVTPLVAALSSELYVLVPPENGQNSRKMIFLDHFGIFIINKICFMTVLPETRQTVSDMVKLNNIIQKNKEILLAHSKKKMDRVQTQVRKHLTH